MNRFPTPSSLSTVSPLPEPDYSGDLEEAHPKARAHRTLAPNLTRRSHKKSRGGCFNCKARKIKVRPFLSRAARDGDASMSVISQLRLPTYHNRLGPDHLPVQCQETRPSCENCTIKELECQYPTKADQHVQRRANDASSAIAIATPSIPQPLVAASDALQFSLTDLKFFHHFLVVAHPHLPLGNEEVWVQKIPLFAQEVRASKQCVPFDH